HASADDRDTHGSRGRGGIADGAHVHSPASGFEKPIHREGEGDAQEEERADLQRGLYLRTVTPATERDGGQLRRARFDIRLAEEKGEATAEYQHRDTRGDIVDLGP